MEAYKWKKGLGPMTVEGFEALPEEGDRLDLVRGWVVHEPPAGYGHGVISAELIRRLANHVVETRAGRVCTSETGFILSVENRTVRGPDAAFVSAARLAQSGNPTGFYPGPPDLAMEVVSPSNRWSDVAAKVRDYLESGTRLVWILDPPSRTVTVHRPNRAPSVLEETEILDGEDLVPGFAVRVGDLYDIG
jgi:Uma2 family endonuclease